LRVSVCRSCGHECVPGAKYCSECGSSLVEAQALTHQERKVITVLFADLVGFTSRAEQLDPEDVRAFLSPYYARLRLELERHGGRVEKFIGDAVVALFGAVVAHEDDPERAVRAAVAIRDWVREEQRLQIRIGVNTGEALITFRSRSAEGEGMAAGDVVNTAARLQSAAPVNGILVGESTYRATRRAIDYEAAQPIEVKGKAEPVSVWEVLQARARFGVDVPHETRTALVGRARELGVLRDVLIRAHAERSPQLVTLLGVPGIGKSRLLYELSRIVDAEPALISWRQGRSLPYGEGISFWALAEMVKAQAGILESDSVEEAEAKLTRMAEEVLPDAAEADWVRRHLGALVGIGGVDVTAGGDRRSEAFAAWRRLFEALAEQRPLVLVFEDLQWADDGLLDFVDQLVDWASGVPILVVCSARPELLERRAGWGGGKPNAVTLSLSPLSDDDTTRLIASLLGGSAAHTADQAALLASAGGNPLYAEQFAQMLGEHSGGGGLNLPESIQGIVGARLDALALPEKRLLQNAAVIGKVFWPGAVEALGDRDDRLPLEERLHALELKQFVRRERRSSVARETQYAFMHVILREVAYAQIPRAGRVEKHVLAAEWIESLGRPEDHAEMRAHHYLSALELARAASLDIEALIPRVRASLSEAGDRARALNAYGTAVRLYRQALELWPADGAHERADLTFRLSVTLYDAADPNRGEALEEARTALEAIGDRSRAAEADSLLGWIWWERGDRDRCYEHLLRAHGLVRDAPPSAEKARVLSQVARFTMLAGEFDEKAALEALGLAEALGLDETRANLLITIGTAHGNSGDPNGRVDIERGLEIALAGNWLDVAVRGYTNLSSTASKWGDLHEALSLGLKVEEFALRLGGDMRRRWVQGNLISEWFELGEWDKCARAAEEFLAESQLLGPHYHDFAALSARAFIRQARGDREGALEDQAAALSRARLAKDPQVMYPALALSGWVLAEAGRVEEGQQLFDELIAAGPKAFSNWDTYLIWAPVLLDRREEIRAALPTPLDTPWLQAAKAVLDEDYVRAAVIFDSIGAAVSAATARLHAAARLIRAGHRAEADQSSNEALAFFRSVGATRFIRECEALIDASARSARTP
jgi:class 3 adenylate cyclase/tetratricopeptide (TPR) repeat protein